MISVTRLTKKYGARVAVSDLSFEVGQGEVVGFLGPNGAGKSTTLRIIAGYLGPTAGCVSVAGFDVVDEPLRARQRLGYMPENSPCYPEMRVWEYLRFRAELKCVAAKQRTAAVARAMDLANLTHRRDSLIGRLSKGYHQRLGLADALVADPPLLILDEPTSGLDPNQIREVRQVIRQLAQHHTVLLSTHILAEVEVSCDRAIVVHEGKLVAEGSLDELRGLGQAKEGSLLVRVPRDAATDDGQSVIPKQPQPASSGPVGGPPVAVLLPVAVRSALGALAEDIVQRQSVDDGLQRWHVRLPDGQQSMERWTCALVGLGYGVAEARLGRPNLEQVFAQLTSAPDAGTSIAKQEQK